MVVRTLEYQYDQEQGRSRRMALLLDGIHLAIGASGAAFVENPGQVQKAFRQFVDDLLDIGESPQPKRKLSFPALRVKYGSRWKDHLDELREEDKTK